MELLRRKMCLCSSVWIMNAQLGKFRHNTVGSCMFQGIYQRRLESLSPSQSSRRNSHTPSLIHQVHLIRMVIMVELKIISLTSNHDRSGALHENLHHRPEHRLLQEHDVGVVEVQFSILRHPTNKVLLES